MKNNDISDKNCFDLLETEIVISNREEEHSGSCGTNGELTTNNQNEEMPLKISPKNVTEELLIRLKNGDMYAFDQVYELYSHKLYSFVLKIIKDEDEAADVIQEVFVKIWEFKDKFGDYKLLNSYIFAIAYNFSISLIRKRVSSNKYLEYLRNSAVVYNEQPGMNEIEFKELSIQVEKLISDLPKRQKQVYLLHREKGLTYTEIANQLGISKNTVENHMVKAIKYFRRNMIRSL